MSISSEVWCKLEQARPLGDQMVARPALPDIAPRVLCALDSQGQRHLLIILADQEEGFHDAQSRGLSVQTRNLLVRGRQAGHYLDLHCHDLAGYPILDLIGTELAQELVQSERQAGETVRRVLGRWRRFWGQLPRTLLSREEIVGLLGEIWLLAVWLIPIQGLRLAVSGWRGPFGSRHDFEWPGKSIEVKATCSTRGRVHWINGVDQLLPPENGRLFLFSVQLREEAGATNSLPGLIGQARRLLEADPDTLGRFETGLLELGYSPAHDEEYAKLRFRVCEDALFSVEADFPRLTAASFSGGVPAGVEGMQYEINLNSFEHLCVARSSSDAHALLSSQA